MGAVPGGQFLLMWFGFLALMLPALGGILVWAIRSRQFSDQDRARYLPLDAEDREKAERDPVTKCFPPP